MKPELLALDPAADRSPGLDRFLEMLRLYRDKCILNPRLIASVIHPYLYAVPTSAYRESKDRFLKEARERVERASRGLVESGRIHVIASDARDNEHHVEQLARGARRWGAGALILAASDRKGLPHWFLGSFSETAALTASLPVFIFKRALRAQDLSREVRFVLAVDVSAPPDSKAIRWIAGLARSSGARVDVVHVEGRKRPLVDTLRAKVSAGEADKVLGHVEAALRSYGVRAQRKTIRETKSVAHALADYAEHVKAWLTITTAAERSKARRLFLGSTARKTLTLTKRPFLSLRLH